MYLSEDKIIEIFYLADEFCQEFEKTVSNHSLGNELRKSQKWAKVRLSPLCCCFIMEHSRTWSTFIWAMFKPICSVIFLKHCHITGSLNYCREPFCRRLYFWKLIVWVNVPAFPTSIQPRSVCARINESPSTKSLMGSLKEESPQWVISLALNFIIWLMTKGKCWILL